MTRQFNVDNKLVWEEGKALEFINEPKNMENEFIGVFPTDIDYSAEDVDQMVKQFTHVIYKVSEPPILLIVIAGKTVTRMYITPYTCIMLQILKMNNCV